jgi:hypothetical protein
MECLWCFFRLVIVTLTWTTMHPVVSVHWLAVHHQSSTKNRNPMGCSPCVRSWLRRRTVSAAGGMCFHRWFDHAPWRATLIFRHLLSRSDFWMNCSYRTAELLKSYSKWIRYSWYLHNYTVIGSSVNFNSIPAVYRTVYLELPSLNLADIYSS